MVNNPIEIPESPNHTFELSDVEDLVNESPTPEQPTLTPKSKDNLTLLILIVRVLDKLLEKR